MDKFIAKLPQYLEDGLSESESIELETHLANCSACQAEFDALTCFDHLLASAPVVAPPTNFVHSVEVRLERRLHRRRTLTGALVISSLLMGISVIVLSGVFGSGSVLWQILGNGKTWTALVDVLGGIAVLGSVAFNIGQTVVRIIVDLVRYPAFWGYMMFAIGTLWLWVQLLRRTQMARQPVYVSR